MAEGGFEEIIDEVVEVQETDTSNPFPPTPPSKKYFKIVRGEPHDETIDPILNSFRRERGIPKPVLRTYPKMIEYYSQEQDSSIDDEFFESIEEVKSPRRFRPDKYVHQSTPLRHREPKSILEWFDRSVETELVRHMESTVYDLDLRGAEGTGSSWVEEMSVYEHDLLGDLQDVQNDMTDAVNSFAKAQALVSFEGAIRAAEKAAASAPPGRAAEEAAVAGAKGYQAELTGVVKQKVPGLKPVEVLGYVGITKPKFRRKQRKI